MKLYNTLTRKKEEFVPIDPKKLKIYTCGPTVYNYIHIGNARPMCVFDVLRRFLEFVGYEVCFVQNFTDVDDKIIKKALAEEVSYSEISSRYIEEYKKDANGLNIIEPSVSPKVSECIPEIIDIIDVLVKKGYAYPAPGGDVYFKTRKFNEYGKLSGQTVDTLISGARVETGEEKSDPLDFALWKSSKPGEPYWESPWGSGRPGWHIECSAMAKKYLGENIDIHCGGQDLIFPHHENEIAQSQSSSGVKFANYWLHNGYINIENKKMSKSLNNFFTVREVSEKYGYEPIRYLMISSHYRNPINYSDEILEQCVSSLKRLYTFKENLKFIIKNSNSSENGCENNKIGKKYLEEFKRKFISCLEDDLNTADAISVMFDMVKKYNTLLSSKRETGLGSKFISDILNLFNVMSEILGILYCENQEITDEEIISLIKKRQEARKSKNWSEADKIRDELRSKGIILEDTPSGVKWHVQK